MAAIIIKGDKANLKILSQLAKKLGATVTSVKVNQYEDFFLGTIMDSQKSGETIPSPL